MYYINAISSVSLQNSFNNKGFSKQLTRITPDSKIIHPEYKSIIKSGSLRRMSPILKMSVANANYCRQTIGSDFDAIIVGTGLGCLQDSFKFLTNYIQIQGLLPPTSFIQSTHNTIAGTISLTQKNNGYNMTHTQNTISFEMALIDGMMCIDEGMENVLIGAADEYIPFLDDIKKEFSLEQILLASGSTFLVLSNKPAKQSIAKITACKTYHSNLFNEHLNDFLDSNHITINDIANFIYSLPFNNVNGEYFTFVGGNAININSYAGIYPTNSALAFHIATDMIEQSQQPQKNIIFNALYPQHLAITLIESVNYEV